MKEKLILGIETSCDETSVAVVGDGRRVLSNIVSSQIDIHKRFGGVVPEIASRNHTMAITGVIDEALAIANVSINDISAIAVTYGAGLVGALLVGVSAAKALSFATGKPLVAVNHIHSHIAANYIAHTELEPPFLCAVTSGGHTSIIEIKTYHDHNVIGATTDDAVGEALDKVARVLGLSYPGGPQIDRLAKSGKPNIEFFKTAAMTTDNYNFSYSGLKTAAINYISNTRQRNQAISMEDISASLLRYAIEPIVAKTFRAAREFGYDKVALSGGVAANTYLRNRFWEEGKRQGIKVYIPPLEYCTDNAAMVASLGYYNYINGVSIADMTLNAVPSL